jgi:hypothetical protein
MSKYFSVILLSLLFMVSFSACSKSEPAADQKVEEAVSQAADESEEDAVATEVAANIYLFKLDGDFEDWSEIEPLWDEGGAEGRGALETNIDIKQVYFKNDDQYLYVFMKISPTLVERFQTEESSGIVGDLYFDTDNDPSTGGTYILMWDSEKYKGYEVRVWIPLGHQTWSGETTKYVGYELYMADGKSFSGLGAYRQDTTREGSLIAHGPDGIEMALPLDKLGIQVPATVRVLLAEFCNDGEEEGYDVATLSLVSEQ